MPDEGASMEDARPTPAERGAGQRGSQHHSRDEVVDERMPEYELEQRKRESQTVIERSGGEGADDGTDQVVPERQLREDDPRR